MLSEVAALLFWPDFQGQAVCREEPLFGVRPLLESLAT